MDARWNFRLTMAVVLVVFGLAMSESPAFAESPKDIKDQGAIGGGWISTEEKARIAALSEAELVKLLKTGIYGQKSAAVDVLLAKDKGDVLLSIAKAGPKDTSEIIIESYVPWALPYSDAGAKESVDAYLTWLEEQLKSESPVVRPEKSVRSIARVAYWAAAEYGFQPLKPRPAPRYQHQRVVSDLIGLLKHKKGGVSDYAAHWLGVVGGYTAEQAKEAGTALEAYRKTVAAQPASKKKIEQERKNARLRAINHAIKDLKRERKRRVRFGVETAVPDPRIKRPKAPATQPAPPTPATQPASPTP